MPDSKFVQYRIVDRLRPDAGDERADVVAALMAPAASIAPKYFYDELGCALYAAICKLPEYYPTRTELAVFREQRSEIADVIGKGGQFVDLGAGDCRKAQSWLPFVSPSRYIAVDIARTEIERALARMAPDYPEIEMLGVVTDFSAGLLLAGVLDERPVTFFYPGSSIGNFTPGDAMRFLATVRAQGRGRECGLLIGVDGKKEKSRLDAAYDDALGVTAAFNRNALLHLNRRYGFDFALEAFAHRGFYAEAEGRIEMHLESRVRQAVDLGGGLVREFAPGERIHTENSYKYGRAEFAELLARAGFDACRSWASPDEGYFVFYASSSGRTLPVAT